MYNSVVKATVYHCMSCICCRQQTFFSFFTLYYCYLLPSRASPHLLHFLEHFPSRITDAATLTCPRPARVGRQRGQLPDQLQSEQITLIWLKDAVGRQCLLTSGAFTVRTAASSSLIYSFTGPNVFTPLHDAMNILHHRCFCTGF